MVGFNETNNGKLGGKVDQTRLIFTHTGLEYSEVDDRKDTFKQMLRLLAQTSCTYGCQYTKDIQTLISDTYGVTVPTFAPRAGTTSKLRDAKTLMSRPPVGKLRTVQTESKMEKATVKKRKSRVQLPE